MVSQAMCLSYLFLGEMTDLYELEPQPFSLTGGKIKALSPEDKKKLRHILVDLDESGKWTDAVIAFMKAVKEAEINQEHLLFLLIHAYLKPEVLGSVAGGLLDMLLS